MRRRKMKMKCQERIYFFHRVLSIFLRQNTLKQEDAIEISSRHPLVSECSRLEIVTEDCE